MPLQETNNENYQPCYVLRYIGVFRKVCFTAIASNNTPLSLYHTHIGFCDNGYM
jgi:hypothetical protein